ncbi:hypothetical protein BMS3Abin03_00189 [bacterium BMS3Abin03]|nr:hypothetical protein BMS3Abin03_00189 [bacterium BMS3Abin03]
MKKQQINTHPSKKNNSSHSDLFLNISILILSVLVIFLAYSLVRNLNNVFYSSPGDKNNKTETKIIQVEVLNGCGVNGIADRFTEYLRVENFDVVNIGNYRSFDVDNSIVIDRTGEIENAKRVAKVLGIDSTRVIQQINDDYFLDVTLIIGKDFNQLSFNK